MQYFEHNFQYLYTDETIVLYTEHADCFVYLYFQLNQTNNTAVRTIT